MASAPEAKRQKTGAESIVGPEELRSWVSKSAARFCPEMRANLLSSRNIHAADVLKFVLEFVFGWSEVEDGTGDSNYYSSITYKDRAMALEFVTQWLGKNPDGKASSLPSLTTLCAQKIAMEVFWLFTTNIDRNFRRSNIEFFTDALKSDMASSLNNKRVPESHHTLVIEELFIFTTIYILYVDLQRLSDEPTEASDLLLPVQTRAVSCRGEWWYNFGMSAVVDVVPDHGWGGLAKVALLPFIVCTNYTTIRRRDMNMIGYGHLEVVFKMFGCDYVNHRYVNARLHSRHPFASSVALTPLASLVRAIVTGDGFRGSEVDEDIVDEVLLPWIKQHARITQRDTSSFSVMYAAAMQSVNPPVPARLRPFQYATLQKAAQDCVDAVEYKELIESLTFHYYREDQHIKRLRMNGNYSKVEILRAVIVSRYAEVVDLEDCSNLDEECFDAVMRQLFHVRVVLLKGTAVDENSAVVKRYRNSDIRFVFSYACKCCGAVKGRIKEFRGSNNS